MDSDTAHDLALDRLVAITQLLHRATTLAWARAEHAAHLRSFALGVYVAQLQANALVTHGSPRPAADPTDRDDDADADAPTVLHLLSAAEQLTRPLPVHPPDLGNVAQLVVELCDLIREARDLEC